MSRAVPCRSRSSSKCRSCAVQTPIRTISEFHPRTVHDSRRAASAQSQTRRIRPRFCGAARQVLGSGLERRHGHTSRAVLCAFWNLSFITPRRAAMPAPQSNPANLRQLSRYGHPRDMPAGAFPHPFVKVKAWRLASWSHHTQFEE